MKVQPPWVLLATLIASGGLTAIAQAFSNALPQGAPLIANIVAIIVAISGFVVQYYKSMTAPAVSILADAPVVTTEGEKVGVNVSTTSTTPLSAPVKGTP